MKQKIILITLLLISSMAVAQNRFDATAWAGINMCQIDGDQAGSYQHLGFHAAINTSFSLSRNIDSHWRMLVELGYTQKGSTVTKNDMSINLHYIEIPIMMTYNIKGFRVGAGIAPAILVNSKVTVAGGDDLLSANNYRRMDALPLMAEASYSFNHIYILARFQISMLSVSKSGGNAYRLFRSNNGQFSRLFSIGLGYKF